MVAGGVGLAPFVTLAEALAGRGTSATLFYGGRGSRRSVPRGRCSRRLDVRVVLTTEDGSRGERGRVTAPLERALDRARRRLGRHAVRLRPDADDARGRRPRRGATGARRSCRSSRSWAAAWAAATVASCPSRAAGGRHFVRVLPRRPGVRRLGRRLGRAGRGTLSAFVPATCSHRSSAPRLASSEEPGHRGLGLFRVRRRVRRPRSIWRPSAASPSRGCS